MKVFYFFVLLVLISLSHSVFSTLLSKDEEKLLSDLEFKMNVYPSQIHFFENKVIQKILGQTLSSDKIKLVNDWNTELPIKNLKSGYLISRCKPHDCGNNKVYLYFPWSSDNSVIVYFHQSNEHSSKGMWFTPIKRCNSVINDPVGGVMDEEKLISLFKAKEFCLSANREV